MIHCSKKIRPPILKPDLKDSHPKGFAQVSIRNKPDIECRGLIKLSLTLSGSEATHLAVCRSVSLFRKFKKSH